MDEIDRSKAKLTLTLDWPEITLDRLSRAASLWAALVESVSLSVTGPRARVKWVVRNIHYGSPLEVESVPSPNKRHVDPFVVLNIGHVVVDGLRHLETLPDVPDHFSRATLGYAEKLSKMADPDKARRIVVSNGTDALAVITKRTADTVSDIVGPTVESYGTIQGFLEGVETHGTRRFYVYETLSGRRVRCHFDGTRVPLEAVLESYGKRVSVGGLIRSKAKTGERISIDANELTAFKPDDKATSPSDILRMWAAER